MKAFHFVRMAAGVSIFFVLLLHFLPLGASAQESPVLKGLSGSERERVAALIEGAKKEKELVLWGSHIEPLVVKKVEGLFRQEYGLADFIIKDTYAGTGEIVAKVEELIRAKRPMVDVVWTSAYTWSLDLLKRGLVMQYQSPEYKHFTLSDKAGLTEPGYWVSDFQGFGPMINQKVMVKKGIETKGLGGSWWDFTDPKFKGMLSLGDASVSTSYAATAQGLMKILGKDYFKKLKENRIYFGKKGAEMRDRVISGESPICLFMGPKDFLMSRERGVDVLYGYPKEGFVPIPLNPKILKNAPHPSAAKLLIDFVRTRRIQEVMLTPGSFFLAGRPDVRNPYPKLQPPKYINLDWKTEGSAEGLQSVMNFFRNEMLD